MMNHWKWTLLLILFVSFVLRFYNLTLVPATLNPDEKFNGYLAYSLLKTGKDLDGNIFPIAIKSFGNWTLIGYPLLTVVPVAIMGLSDFSARLVGVVSGVISIALIYFVTQELFKKRGVSALAALFFAVSPWSIYFSRISHETGLGLTLFLGGLLFFLKEKRVAAAVLFGFSLLTHFSYVIFTSLMLGTLVIYFRPKITKTNIFSGILYGAILFVVVWSIARGGINEIKDVGLFSNRDILYSRVDRYLGDGSYAPGDYLYKIHNRLTGIAYQLGQNYIASFSPKFLFDEGGQGVLHNLGYFGWLYQIDFFFIILGVIFICWKRERLGWIVLAWLAISPLTSFFTKDHPSSTRLFPMSGAFAILSAYGASELIAFFEKKSKVKYLLSLVIAIIFAANFLFFLDYYFVHFNNFRARFLYYGFKEAAMMVNANPDKKVVLIGPENFPYINFLFYSQYDPNKFRSEVVYYPQGGTEFRFVKGFGRFEFPWAIDRVFSQDGVLYFDRTRPADSRNIIRLPSGEPLFTYYTLSDLDPLTTDVR